MPSIPSTELLLNPDNSIYHLNLYPEDIANDILLVGDPGRADFIASLFDSVLVTKQKREFHTHTGYYNSNLISVISTGIGPDNIDIVMNELDALANIDFDSREAKGEVNSLNIVRIGTCGGLQSELKPNTPVISSHGLGLDNLINFYTYQFSKEEETILDALNVQMKEQGLNLAMYLTTSNDDMFAALKELGHSGITATCPGFYAPQGRTIRTPVQYPGLLDALHTFAYQDRKVTNFEMESSALFLLASLLGHRACTADVVVANRITNEASVDYKPALKQLAGNVLDVLSKK